MTAVTTPATPRVRRRTRLGALGVVLAALVALLSACSTTMRDIPIPGTGVGGDTTEIKAEFGDALNLAVGAPVKVNGVDMGRVEEVAPKDFSAVATLAVKKEALLREGARVRLRYTTPLGELFVDVTNPADGPALKDGAVLTQQQTSTAPSVEDTLAQASLLINGGGLEQLQTITEELNTALNGNESDYRTLLDRASVFLTQANATTRSIDRVLTSLDSLSSTLNGRSETINRVVKDIEPAARVLRRNTPDFTRLLAEVEKFSAAASSTVTATRSQLLTVVREIEPVLAEFARSGPDFDRSLRALIEGAKTADAIVATDYLNISLELHLDGTDVGGLVGGTIQGLLGLLGLDGTGLGSGQLLDLGNLLGLGRTAAPSTTRGGAANPPRSSIVRPPQSTSPGTTPGGLTGLLGGLLGGRS